MKKSRIPKFWSHYWAAVPFNTVIFGLRPKIKILLPTFFLPCPPVSEKVSHDPIRLNSPEEIDLA